MWKSVTLSLMLIWSCQQAAHAGDRHYLLIFASQGQPVVPQTSHTFAVFAKSNGESKECETQCISWMPQNLQIELLRSTPVNGKNLNLDESFKWARSIKARTTMWGPFLIKPELYEMAVAQVKRLNSNAVDYLALDGTRRRASNCIHAVSDLDTTRGRLNTGTAFGESASQAVLRHFERYILEDDQPTQWLIDQLGLKSTEIRFVTTEPVANDARSTREGLIRSP